MGKPFHSELKLLPNTISWAAHNETKQLRDFLCAQPTRPLICVGSGGALTACHFIVSLYREYCGIANALTPLELMSINPLTLENTKILLVSASGSNKDILQVYSFCESLQHVSTAHISMQLDNKLSSVALKNENHLSLNYQIPSGKDGFLATNSLIGFCVLCLKAFIDVSCEDILNQFYSINCSSEQVNVDCLHAIDYFLVVYGKEGHVAAIDFESKMSEAGLGAVLLSDYRNFGHGRHNWIDKKKDNTCVIALFSNEEKDLAIKTISVLPKSTIVLKINTSSKGFYASIDLLLQIFNLVEKIGQIRKIDPGCPGVPNFGSILYNLNCKKILKNISFQTSLVDELPILRKLHVCSKNVVEKDVWETYKDAYTLFLRKINDQKYDAIVFDYDGTLNSVDKNSRYKKNLHPKIVSMMENFLRHNVSVAIITGRGKSIVELIRNSIMPSLFDNIYIGNYNGMCIYPMSDPIDIEQKKRLPLHNQLDLFVTQLKKNPLFHKNIMIEKRENQVTITSVECFDQLMECCQELIHSMNLDALYAWRSSHSTDIVVREQVDKRNVSKILKGPILYIGDSGKLFGNDFQMLSEPFSLSVDQVSFNPESCWNCLPVNCVGMEGTLYYASRIRLYNGYFKIKLG